MVLELTAYFSIAARGLDRECPSCLSPDLQVKTERQGRGIEGRAQIGRSGRKNQFQSGMCLAAHVAGTLINLFPLARAFSQLHPH